MRITDKDAFDRICGDCAGVDIATLTETDIRAQAQVWRESGENLADDQVEAAIRHLYRLKQESFLNPAFYRV